MKSRIGYKLIIALLLFSSLITLVTTALQLYFDYRVDLKRVNNYEALIRESYLKSIATSVWLYNDKQIQTQLHGILHLPDMEHIQILSDEGANWSVGTVSSKNKLIKEFPLLYMHKGKLINIGVLKALVSLDNIYTRLFKKAFTILLSNAIKTFLVSGFMLLIFQYLVTRHLYSLSAWMKNMDIGRSFEKFHLDRPVEKSKKEDELDEVVIAINEMQNNLKNYITDRKIAEDALRKSEAHLRTLIDTIPDLVWLKDLDGIYLSCNSKFERFFGAKESDIAGKTDYDFVDKELADFFREKDKIAMAAGMPSINEEEITYADDGHKELLETVKTPMYTNENKLIGVLGVARDITYRKRAEEEKAKLKIQLAQAQKMESIGTLAGGIAHDFNNILYPLIGFAEMLQEDLEQNSPEHESVTEIFHAALRAKDLVKQILAFSRQIDQTLKPVRLQSILKEAFKLLKSSIPTTIGIELNINPDCGMVVADPTQIHQIVMNLATNAYHAMQDSGGQLNVSLDQVEIDAESLGFSELLIGKYALLKVIDTGAGIEKEVMDKIFDPYFTTKETGKGTGLGLSVVQGIVKSCHGDIQVYSEPGKGTEIYVYLPIMKKITKIDSPDPSQTIQGGKERILLVDDEEMIVKMEKQMLERLGYHVTTGIGSIEALDLFKENPDTFDLMITDMTMPHMTGLQLAGKIKDIRFDIPIIICTGFSDQINEKTFRKMGIQGYVLKPVIKREIAKTIRDVLNENQGTGK